jgi:hypothetical protein
MTLDLDLTGIANATTATRGEIEVTVEMVDAGEEALLADLGGADLGGNFSARELATRVYQAMHDAAPSERRVP